MKRNKPSPHVRNPFYHPGPDEYDFERLLEALKAARGIVKQLTLNCGLRNPIYREAEGLLAQINAVAALTRVAGAAEYVNPDDYTVQRSRFPDCTPQEHDDGQKQKWCGIGVPDTGRHSGQLHTLRRLAACGHD